MSFSHIMRLFVLLSILFLTGCASRRHLEGANISAEWQAGDKESRDKYLQSLGESQVDFQAITARAKGFLTLNEQENHEVSIQLRMQRDSAIWVSATAMLGMEVGRMLIRPDSVMVVNRVEGSFQLHAFDKLSEWLGYALTFGDLQDLLTGNAGAQQLLRSLPFFTSTEGQGRFFAADRAEIIFDPNFRLGSWQIRNFFGERLEVRHVYYPKVSDPRFPSKTSIFFQTPRLKLITTLDYDRLELSGQVALPFSIPKGYRQMY